MGEDGAFRYTEAKSRSALAQKVRDTARRNGRPATLAEKMVDKDMVVFEATHKTGGETAYFSNKEWEALDDARIGNADDQSVKQATRCSSSATEPALSSWAWPIKPSRIGISWPRY